MRGPTPRILIKHSGTLRTAYPRESTLPSQPRGGDLVAPELGAERPGEQPARLRRLGAAEGARREVDDGVALRGVHLCGVLRSKDGTPTRADPMLEAPVDGLENSFLLY